MIGLQNKARHPLPGVPPGSHAPDNDKTALVTNMLNLRRLVGLTLLAPLSIPALQAQESREVRTV